MEITREELETRLQQAISTKETKMKEALLAEGIIQDCNYWLGEIEKKESSKKPKKDLEKIN